MHLGKVYKTTTEGIEKIHSLLKCSMVYSDDLKKSLNWCKFPKQMCMYNEWSSVLYSNSSLLNSNL